MFSQVQQVTGTGDFEAGYPNPRHGRTWEASYGNAKRTNSLFRQFGWASPFYPATKHCWWGKTQGEIANSGHLPGSTITSRTSCHCTSTTRLSPFHCTICAAFYSAWSLTGDVLQPLITFSYATISSDTDIQSSCSLLHSAIKKEKTREGAHWKCHKKICKTDIIHIFSTLATGTAKSLRLNHMVNGGLCWRNEVIGGKK